MSHPRPLKSRMRRGAGDLWSRLPHALQPPRLKKRDNWAIGIYGGPDLLALGPMAGVRNPILDRRSISDVDAAFVADPFLMRWSGAWYLFFEVFDWDAEMGVIAAASSPDARRWRYEGVVLTEPYHLSYPFPIEIDGVPHLIVESSTAEQVRAYRAVDFPSRWEPAAVLLADGPRVDPTLFRHGDTWWLFTARYADHAWRRLELHAASNPLGPFIPHPASPVVANDPRIARPGGRVVRDGSRLFRFGQDCSSVYGERLFAAEILELTADSYRERPIFDRPVLKGRGRGWNRARMHHLDAHRLDDGTWLAAVDGW